MHVRPTVVTALAAALLAAAGCGGSPDGAEEAQSSAPPSASAPTAGADGTSSSPTPTPKRTYPEDKPVWKITASEVARIWVRAYGHAILTGDTARMRRMSTKRCVTCDSFASLTERVYGAGGSIDPDGRPRSVLDVIVVSTDQEKQQATLRLKVRSAGGTTWKAKNSKPIDFAPKTEWLYFEMVIRNSRWLVDEVAGD